VGAENSILGRLKIKETSKSPQVRKSAALAAARRGKQNQGEVCVGCQATGHLDETKISLLLIKQKIIFSVYSSYFC
jgi:hypothetical protein